MSINKNIENIRLKSTLFLLFVTMIWGWTFIWMKQSTNAASNILGENLAEELEQIIVGFFVLMRFGIAAFIFMVVYPPARAGFKDKEIWRGGLILGSLAWGGFFFQMLAIPNISPAVSAFLTSLYVIFTALIGVLMGKQRVTWILGVGIFLATFGAGILGLKEDQTVFDLFITFGLPEWLTILCALIFGAHIIATDEITKKVDALQVTGSMLVVVSLLSLLTFFLIVIRFYYFDGDISYVDNVVLLITKPSFLFPLLMCAILGSLLALLLLNIYQKHLSPVRAAILYALEPVWAAIFSITLGLENTTKWLFAGAICLLLGNLIVELRNTADDKKTIEEAE
tara:strand:+ start:261 stop:1280 length:1020 start_codon:yes stop_codon:yes gene_type:complete